MPGKLGLQVAMIHLHGVVVERGRVGRAGEREAPAALRQGELVQLMATFGGLAGGVLWIVADRLAQPEGQWKPFEPSGVLGMVHRALTHEAVPI